MKILLADTFHYPRGGASIIVLRLAKLLRSNGHTVNHFAMQHPNSLPCPETERFWPSYIEYPKLLEEGGLRNFLRVFKTSISSTEAEMGIRELLRQTGPYDIVNFHNIMHHLTPSIIKPIKEKGIPIVWTLHDYSLICPNTNFLDDRTGRLCHKCLKGGLHFVNAPLSRCKKSSFKASLMAAIEAWAHRISQVSGQIDLFISPSRFLSERFVEAGFDPAKFKVIPNFIEAPKVMNRDVNCTGDYVLYFGRISPEKGIDVLIDAWRKVPRSIPLKIAGSGPLLASIRNSTELENVQFLGFVEPEKLGEIRSNARFTVLPSVCWENFPLSAQESLAEGVPIIASNIGGIPEIVIDGHNGILFEAGNSDKLAEAVIRLWNSPDLCKTMGINGIELVEKLYRPERYLEELITTYSSVIRS